MADWLLGYRNVCCRWFGVIAFARIHLKAFLAGGNLDLAELAVPILVFGVVAQAVLVVQFVGDLIQRVFELINTPDLQHSPAGSLGKFF